MDETVVSYAVQNGPWAVAAVFACYLIYKWGGQLVTAQVESLDRHAQAAEITSQMMLETSKAIEKLAETTTELRQLRDREAKGLECLIEACKQLGSDNPDVRSWLDRAISHLSGIGGKT